MENKLFVGNLSYNATEEELQALFEKAGTVQSVTIVKDRDTGRSKGFAFVEMATQDEAQKAISQLHGSEFHERALTVNVARPREERGGRGGRDNRGRHGAGGRRHGGGEGRGEGRGRRSW